MNKLKVPTNLNAGNPLDSGHSLETTSLNEQTNYRLMRIGKIRDYFDQEIKYQQFLTSKLSKYLTGFDYADKILTVFLTVFSGTNIFAHVRGRKQLAALISSIFLLLFCLSSGVVKKLQQETKTRKEKHNRLLYLAKNKLDCVEMLISKSVENGIIDHNELLAIIKEKKGYGNQKNGSDKSKLSEVEIVLFFSIINMVFITADTFTENCIYTIKQQNNIKLLCYG